MSILCDDCVCTRNCSECTQKECVTSLFFTVPGTPMGKGRPRFVNVNGCAKVYTPKATKKAEENIRDAYSRAYPGVSFGSAPVALHVVSYMPIPKSASKLNKLKMLNDIIKHTHKPDADNILKLVSDALNGLAYDDDRQIVSVYSVKRYSETPRTEITVTHSKRGEIRE